MGFRDFIESTPLGQWSSPALITICDMRLGLLYWSLTSCAVIIGIVTVSGPDGYYKQEAASIDGSKYVALWFEGNDDMKSVSKGTASYCDPDAMSTFDYYYYENFETYDDRFYSDTNNLCRSYMIGEVASKPGGGGAFVTTFIKETHSVENTCSSITSCTADYPAIALTPDVEESSDSCKCVTMQNFFILGAEKVKVAFSHEFDIGPEEIFGNAAGTASSERGQRHKIHTTFKKDGEVYHRKSDGKEMTFKPEFGASTSPVLSLEDYLDLAGLSDGLDTRNYGVGSSARTVSHPQPTVRSTGAIITVNLEYQARINEDGSTDDGHIDCTVTAEASYGWNNMGYLVTYVLQRTLDEDSVHEELYNRYRRGVSIQFKAVGSIEKWDFFYAFSIAVDLVVVITMILPLIISSIATMYLPDFNGKLDKTSMTIYKNVLKIRMNEAKAKTKIAAYTLIAAIVFKIADTDQDLLMTEEEVMRVFQSCGLAVDVARALSTRLVGGDGKMNIMALANLISSDEASVEDVAEVPVKCGIIIQEGNKVLPDPTFADQNPDQNPRSELVTANVTVPPGAVAGQLLSAKVPDGRNVQAGARPGQLTRTRSITAQTRARSGQFRSSSF